jgi:preprotein translocase subunit SecG
VQTIQTVLLAVQVVVAIGLVIFILLQHGRGADAGAAFGSGASSTVFGARGSGNFLSRSTAVLALVFVTNSLGLAWIAKERVREATSLMEGQQVLMQQPAAPAAPETPAETASPEPAPASEVPALPEGQ